MKNYYSVSVDDLLKELNTSLDGIKSSEVNDRIEKYGSNKMPDNNKHSLLKIIVGELLDVDGDCGGYNLGFAWLSGLVVGDNI